MCLIFQYSKFGRNPKSGKEKGGIGFKNVLRCYEIKRDHKIDFLSQSYIPKVWIK